MNRTDGYRLLALTELGRCWPQALPAAVVAERRGIPAAYLANLVGDLARAGVVRTRRGPGGGLALARPPADIPLTEIVGRWPELPVRAGTVDRVEAAVAGAVRRALGSLTVADLVEWDRGDAPEYCI